ncbi:TolC family protein [Sphingomonas sp. NCPPB 2930]
MSHRLKKNHPALAVVAFALLHSAVALAQTPPTLLPGTVAPRSAPPAPSGGAPALNLPAATAAGAAALAPMADAPRISLQQLTDTVLQYNPGLLAAERARQGALAAITSAGALPNPTLDYTRGDQTPRAGASSLSGRLQTVGVSQLIENPLVRRARVEAATAGERGSAQQVAVTRNELVAQIRLRAYEYLLRQSEAVAAGEALSLLEQVNSRVRARVDSGEAPRYELIKAEAEIVNARSLQQSALLQAEQAAIFLNRLAAGALPARWQLDASLTDSANVPPLETLRVEALSQNPELRVLQAENDRARAQLGGARAGRWPGVTLNYTQSREPEVKQNILGVSLQIPLLDQRAGPIAEADAEVARTGVRLEGRRAELEQQLQYASKALEMAGLRVQALSEGAVRDAEAALRVADAAYRFGERGILDVLDAQRVLRGVRADLITARYQVQAARTELDLLSGRFATPGALAR